MRSRGKWCQGLADRLAWKEPERNRLGSALRFAVGPPLFPSLRTRCQVPRLFVHYANCVHNKGPAQIPCRFSYPQQVRGSSTECLQLVARSYGDPGLMAKDKYFLQQAILTQSVDGIGEAHGPLQSLRNDLKNTEDTYLVERYIMRKLERSGDWQIL